MTSLPPTQPQDTDLAPQMPHGLDYGDLDAV
jgi:hypothetical protein